MDAGAATPSTGKRWSDLRRSTRCALVATLLLTLALGCELAARAYCQLTRGIPFFRGDLLWQLHYQEMGKSGVAAAPETRDDETFDVLVLAASVWHPQYGDLAERLPAALAARVGRPVRVYNVAYPARTSLDSYQRYRRLGRKRFDLVIVYHGINDLFVNNCPPGTFRADYRHAPRFDRLLALDDWPTRYVVLPYMLYHQLSRFREDHGYLVKPCRERQDENNPLLTPPCFEKHLTMLLDLAKERGDPVLLMTFAHHIPADYSLAAFRAHQLDYGQHLHEVETWAPVALARRGLAAHNAIIARLASTRAGVLFVDQQRLLPPGKECFNDCCHLTHSGCTRFLHNILDGVDWGKLTAGKGAL